MALPLAIALLIDGSAVTVAVTVRAALRDRRPESPRPLLPGRSREAGAVPPPAMPLPAGEAAGLAGLISGVMTASGITAGLCLSGEARTACQSLVLAAAALLLAAAGYWAGLRDRRFPQPPAPSSGQDTVDVGAYLLRQMYGQPSAPEPRRPRPRPRPGGPDGRSWPPPGTGTG